VYVKLLAGDRIVQNETTLQSKDVIALYKTLGHFDRELLSVKSIRRIPELFPHSSIHDRNTGVSFPLQY